MVPDPANRKMWRYAPVAKKMIGKSSRVTAVKVTKGGDQGIHSLSLSEKANHAESAQVTASADKTSARFFQRSSARRSLTAEENICPA
jgi:hypothetical protein